MFIKTTDYELIVQKHAEVKTMKKIADEVGCSKSTVANVFKLYNLKAHGKLGRTKICAKCHIEKNIEDFYWKQKSRKAKDSHCISCRKIKDACTRDACKDKHDNNFYEENYLRKCATCKESKHISEFYKHKSSYSGYRHNCKKCFDFKKDLKYIWCLRLANRAKQNNIVCTITPEDLILPETCPILGVKLKYQNCNATDRNMATIDKIKPELGYIKGNIIIMSRLANTMKNCATFDELKSFCENISKLIKTYENQGALENITDVFSNIKLLEI